MRKIITVYLLTLLSFWSLIAQPANQLSPTGRFSQEQCQLKRNTSYRTIIVKDTIFNSLLCNKRGIVLPSATHVYNRRSALVLGLTKDTVGIENDYYVQLALEVKYIKIGTTRPDSTKVKLSIDYKRAKGTNYKAKDYLVLDSVIWASIKIDTFYTNIATLTSRLFDIEYRIMGEQDLKPTPTERVNNFTIDKYENRGNYTLKWTPVVWAKSYDIEWQFADGYSSATPSFRNNSTRINVTTKHKYTVPMISSKGTFLARIRPIGTLADGAIFRGLWTDVVTTPVVDGNIFEQDLKPWQYVASFAEDGLRKDVVNFSDGSGRERQSITRLNSGLQKMVVGETYYDHQGRPVIQSMPSPAANTFDSPLAATMPSRSRSTSGSTSGMPSIDPRFLPPGFTPGGITIPESAASDIGRIRELDIIRYLSRPTPDMKYISGFNKTDEGLVFDRRAFDLDLYSDGCTVGTKSMPMSSAFGAGKYFSPSNDADPIVEPHAQYIPNAEGYPYFQVEYTPDNTNRIRRKGMAGSDFQLGSGHETKYYYSVPSQRELYRIFGHNAGKASHYSKVLMEDPNGQLYLTYMNAKGQTIASALAGQHTNINIQALTDKEPPLQDKVDIMAQSNRIIDNLSTSEAAQTFFVEDNGTRVDINYSLSATQMRAMICGANVCYDCPKKLVISLRDNCGVVYINDSITIGTLTDGSIATCESIPKFRFDRSLTLGRGEYHLFKSLKIIETAREKYVSDYITRDTACFVPAIDLPPCITTEDCVLCNYDVSSTGQIKRAANNNPICKRFCSSTSSDFDMSLFNALCMDVTPHGQYGAIDPRSAKWRVSFFNTSPATALFSKHYRSSDLIYLDLTGKRDSIDVTALDVSMYDLTRVYYRNGRMYVLPNDIIDLNFLSSIWKDTWSEALVALHPEYPYFRWNNMNAPSINFDQNMQNTKTWDEAYRKSMIRNDEVIDLAYLENDPFYRDNSEQRDVTFASLNSVLPAPLHINVYQMAKVAMYCSAPIYGTNTDSMRNCIARVSRLSISAQEAEAKNFAWDFIKAKYQKEKQIRVDVLREANLVAGSTHPLAGSHIMLCIDQKSSNDCGRCTEEMRRSPLNDSLSNCIARVKHVSCITESVIPRPDRTGRVFTYQEAAAENALQMMVNCGISLKGKHLWDLMNALITHRKGSLLTGADINITGLPPLVMNGGLISNFPNKLSSNYYWTGTVDRNKLSVVIKDEAKTIQASFILEKDSPESWENIVYIGCMTMYRRTGFSMVALPNIGFTALMYGFRFNIKMTNVVNIDFSMEAANAEVARISSHIKDKGKTIWGNNKGTCNLCLPHLTRRVVPADPCDQIIATQQNEILAAKLARARHLRDSIYRVYTKACLDPIMESLTVTKISAIYHYTLFYYDQSGYLIKTVPPKAVNILTDFTFIDDAPSVFPSHNNALCTYYTYNSLGGKLSKTTSDGGTTKWAYDGLGRPIVSQDAVQAADNTHGYLIYDDIGRNIESGVILRGVASIGTWLTNGKANYSVFNSAISSRPLDKREINRMYYDDQVFAHVAPQFLNRRKLNTRNRVASTAYFTNGASLSANNYQHAFHFNYNVAGHLTELVQDFAALATLSGLSARVASNYRFKKTRYTFDLITGKIKEIEYQPASADQFYHWYHYDADNRLISVATGRSRFEPADRVDHDVSYKFYTHGNIARAEFGEENIQGLDLTYTINGWLKGINRVGSIDPGTDGSNGFLSDVYQQESKYYTGDYKPIKFETSESGLVYHQLFNGNISAIQNKNRILDGDVTHIHKYKYDQLSRLVSSQRGNDDAYATSTSYDKNGNITRMTRKDRAGRIFDDLTYLYSSSVINNKLRHITDASSFRLRDDVDLASQSSDNYQYDFKGRLITDQAEGQGLSWLHNDKLKQITEASQTIDFYYDALGRRIFKKNNQTNIGELTIRDFGGKVMAEYEIKNNNLYLLNIPIYADARIGVLNLDTLISNSLATNRWSQERGAKVYEFKNQIGDINALVSDRRINDGVHYVADVRKATEYFPYGMIMPDRDSSLIGYRYGFQGMEQDDDSKGKGNSISTDFRQYDPRVGRWMSIDPLDEKYPSFSSYVAFNNNPIYFRDPKGDDAASDLAEVITTQAELSSFESDNNITRGERRLVMRYSLSARRNQLYGWEAGTNPPRNTTDPRPGSQGYDMANSEQYIENNTLLTNYRELVRSARSAIISFTQSTLEIMREHSRALNLSEAQEEIVNRLHRTLEVYSHMQNAVDAILSLPSIINAADNLAARRPEDLAGRLLDANTIFDGVISMIGNIPIVGDFIPTTLLPDDILLNFGRTVFRNVFQLNQILASPEVTAYPNCQWIMVAGMFTQDLNHCSQRP